MSHAFKEDSPKTASQDRHEATTDLKGSKPKNNNAYCIGSPKKYMETKILEFQNFKLSNLHKSNWVLPGTKLFKHFTPLVDVLLLLVQDSLKDGLMVKFNNLVEVEALVVPVCPEHHSRFIQLREVLVPWCVDEERLMKRWSWRERKTTTPKNGEAEDMVKKLLSHLFCNSLFSFGEADFQHLKELTQVRGSNMHRFRNVDSLTNRWAEDPVLAAVPCTATCRRNDEDFPWGWFLMRMTPRWLPLTVAGHAPKFWAKYKRDRPHWVIINQPSRRPQTKKGWLFGFLAHVVDGQLCLQNPVIWFKTSISQRGQAPGRSCLRALLGSAKAVTAGLVDSNLWRSCL